MIYSQTFGISTVTFLSVKHTDDRTLFKWYAYCSYRLIDYLSWLCSISFLCTLFDHYWQINRNKWFYNQIAPTSMSSDPKLLTEKRNSLFSIPVCTNTYTLLFILYLSHIKTKVSHIQRACFTTSVDLNNLNNIEYLVYYVITSHKSLNNSIVYCIINGGLIIYAKMKHLSSKLYVLSFYLHWTYYLCSKCISTRFRFKHRFWFNRNFEFVFVHIAT